MTFISKKEIESIVKDNQSRLMEQITAKHHGRRTNESYHRKDYYMPRVTPLVEKTNPGPLEKVCINL